MGVSGGLTFCQEHLNDTDRKSIAEGLYKVVQHYPSTHELHGLCPFHNEKEASFSYNYVKDVFSCQGCGVKPGDLIDLWCHANGRNRKDGGFKAFCDAAGLNWETVREWLSNQKGGTTSPAKKKTSTSKKQQPATEPVETIDESGWKQKVIPETVPDPLVEPEEKIIPEEVWEAFPSLPDDMIDELTKRRKWSREGIKQADLRLYTHRTVKEKPKPGEPFRKIPYGEKRVAIPVRDDAGVLRNIRLYAPFGTDDKYPKITSWATGYGEARLLPPPSTWSAGPLWYCEGEPDWICAISQGLNAITKTGGAKTHKKEWNRHFRSHDVIFVYDADKTGLEGAEKGAVYLEKDAESVRVVLWPRFMYSDNEAPKWDGKKQFSEFVMQAGADYPQDHGNDLTDFFARLGQTEKDLRDLLTTAKSFVSPQTAEAVEMGGARRFFGGSRGTTFKPVLLADAYLKDHPIVTDPVSKRPYLWNGSYFEEYDPDYISNTVTLMLGTEAKTNYVNDASNIIKNLALLPYGQKMNNSPEWLCLKNGMLNINNGEFKSHAQEFFSSFQLGVSYNPHAVEQECPECKGKEGDEACELCWGRGYLYGCTRWTDFLKENLKVRESIMQLQEFAGYILTRDVRYKKCLFLSGMGDDGKSKVVDIFEALAGASNCSAVSITELDKPFSRAMLYNKSLNVSAELEGDAMHSEAFKKLVAGDSITAEFKHKDGFAFKYMGKLIFAANNPPRFYDNTDGLYTRFIIIRFKESYPEGDPRRDTNLGAKLMAELDHIFLWALDGLERLVRQGRFTHSDDSSEALMDFKRSNNPLLIWSEDRLLYRPGHPRDLRISKDAAYKNYEGYCAKYRYKPLGFTAFGRGMRGIFRGLADGRLRDESRDKCYMGLTFADSEEAAAILRDEMLAAAAPGPSPVPSRGRAPQYIEGVSLLNNFNNLVPDERFVPDVVPDGNGIRDAKSETKTKTCGNVPDCPG